MAAVIPMILCGGAGSRLWPLSTDERPKQFLSFDGGLSLFQQTIARIPAEWSENLVVVANEAHAGTISAQLGDAAAATLVLEPARRDSGPAIAAGVAVVRRQFGDEAIIAVLPSDHHIEPVDQFHSVLRTAAAAATRGRLMTLGIQPHRPATEYGYIELGPPLDDLPGVSAVAKFHEKPDADRARSYLEQGGHFWNSGMFLFTAGTFASEASRVAPEMWEAAEAAVRDATRNAGVLHLGRDAFLASPSISIDYAVFERSQSVGVLRVSFQWSDLGNWQAVHGILDRDGDGNVLSGDVRAKQVDGSYIRADGIPVRILGVRDLVVVATPDGVLITTMDQAANVKSVL